MLEEALDGLGGLLPELARLLAMDSKALAVAGARPGDADVGLKRYETVERDGAVRETALSWFGYKPHLLVDAAARPPSTKCRWPGR